MAKSEKEDAIVVFTSRSPERIAREGGSQRWSLNPARAKLCTWLVCTQNRHNQDHEFSDATEAHGFGFLLGKISGVRPSLEDSDRWLITISEFARISYPRLWRWRNPTHYTSLEELGIDPDNLDFQQMPESDEPLLRRTTVEAVPMMLTISEAKKALAATFGVRPEAVEITIRA